MNKTHLTIRYDVTHLTDDEIDALERASTKLATTIPRLEDGVTVTSVVTVETVPQ